jgi:hypothetical protein
MTDHEEPASSKKLATWSKGPAGTDGILMIALDSDALHAIPPLYTDVVGGG